MIKLRTILGTSILGASLLLNGCGVQKDEPKEVKVAQSCNEALGGKPYRYLYRYLGKVIYETCQENQEGKPIVYWDIRRR